MASYEDLGFGKFKIYVELGYDERGKRNRRTKTITATSQRDLNKKIRDFEIKCFNEKDEPIDKITFSSFVEKWIKNHVEPNLTLTSKETYAYLLNECGVLDHFGNMKLKDIKKFHIVEYLANEQANHKPSIPNKYLLLKSIFARALEWDVIHLNPTAGIKEPKREKKKVDYYNEEELNHLFKVLDDCYPKHRIMIKLAAIGGLRRGEILGIREESLDFENNTIYIDKQLRYDKKKKKFYLAPVKNKKPRTVYFPKEFMEELKKYHVEFKARRMQVGNLWRSIHDDNDNMINLLLVREDGYPTHLNTMRNEWDKIIKRYELKHISFHQLRHSCASLMVKKGVNFKVIQERLGHANIGITLDLYSHLEEDQHKESTNVFEHLF
ncbi:tyrosine-type recombinase/integrase [Gracilibacillus salitolerans]|uniref:Tyrosine-type recombinase/integrase n=1 Tax=Gracilibacillus salitolerans TaxID=2663022 RepID=A0A5Q2TM73_9BACI|nr:site-specific integrase [Gracilibacillus salitolerans]QGH35177.1 tyrosine-type recombinase/integrase [Gracilibacillus salitolerans]